MKILQLIDTLNIGGAERMAINISNVLSKKDEVMLCVTHREGALSKQLNKNIRLSILNKKNKYDVFAFIKLIKLVKNQKIDLIHAHSSSIYWAFLVKIFFPKLKLLFHDHYGLSEKLTQNDRKVLQFISYKIDGIITVNDILKNWNTQNTKVKPENIVYINNFPLVEDRKIVLTDTLHFKIVCLANLRPQKDHLNLIEAIAIATQKISDIKLQVIFAGSYEKNEYYTKITETIVKNNLQSIIKIIGAVDNIDEILSEVDLGVLSSVSEGLPVSILEIGSYGIPMIATDVGQCSKVLDYGNAGWIVPPNNPKELANALIDAIKNSEKRNRFGENLKYRITKNYGYQNFLEKYFMLLKNI